MSGRRIVSALLALVCLAGAGQGQAQKLPPAKPQIDAAQRIQALKRLNVAVNIVANHPAPPTLTMGAQDATSVVVSGRAYSSPIVAPTSSAINCVGRTVANPNGAGSTWIAGVNTNYGPSSTGRISYAGSYYASNNTRCRWQTDAPRQEIILRRESNFRDYALWVDGQPIDRLPHLIPSGGTASQLLVDWTGGTGTNALTYGISYNSFPTIVGGGTGHAVGDILPCTGGTFTNAAKIQVMAVSSGVVTNAAVLDQGAYSVPFAGTTCTQGTSSGSGTGASFTILWQITAQSTRAYHSYELRLTDSGKFGGLMVDKQDTVRPWPLTGPLFIVMGDSIVESKSEGWVGGTWPSVLGEVMGVDNIIVTGISSAGYIATGGSYKFQDRLATDLYPLISTDPAIPTVLIVSLGINDYLQTPSAIQAAVTAAYSEIIARYPNLYIVVVGPSASAVTTSLASFQAVDTAVQAGLAATPGWNSRRHAFISLINTTNNILVPNNGYATVPSSTTGNTSVCIGSDTVHPGPSCHVYLGQAIAREVRRLIQTQFQ